MQKPESILENETDKVLWDFEIKNRPPNRGHKKTDLLLINKKSVIGCIC